MAHYGLNYNRHYLHYLNIDLSRAETFRNGLKSDCYKRRFVRKIVVEEVLQYLCAHEFKLYSMYYLHINFKITDFE